MQKREPVSFNISDVTVHPKAFHPGKGEIVPISYRISRPAKAIIKIFDPDMSLVRDLLPEDTGNPGLHKVIWDGRDLEERLVPDEAYFFTIEAKDYEAVAQN